MFLSTHPQASLCYHLSHTRSMYLQPKFLLTQKDQEAIIACSFQEALMLFLMPKSLTQHTFHLLESLSNIKSEAFKLLFAIISQCTSNKKQAKNQFSTAGFNFYCTEVAGTPHFIPNFLV